MANEIESEAGFCINMGLFLKSWITVVNEIKSEAGFCIVVGS